MENRSRLITLTVLLLCGVVGCRRDAILAGKVGQEAELTEDELVRLSFVPWSAFQCAAVTTDDKEAERLLKLGLDSGRRFVKMCIGEDGKGVSATAHKNKCAAVSSKISMFWSGLGFGSADFTLGQVFQLAKEHVSKDIYLTVNGSFPPKKVIEIRRTTKFQEMNCQLLR
jgi:hypothetical protein